MIKTLARCLMVGASTFCAVQGLFTAGTAIAQPPTQRHNRNSDHLFPLETRSFVIESQALALDAVGDRINTQVSDERSAASETTGLDINELPIIGDLVDEDGNFDWGMDLPVSVEIGTVMGETGLVISTDLFEQ